MISGNHSMIQLLILYQYHTDYSSTLLIVQRGGSVTVATSQSRESAEQQQRQRGSGVASRGPLIHVGLSTSDSQCVWQYRLPETCPAERDRGTAIVVAPLPALHALRCCFCCTLTPAHLKGVSVGLLCFACCVQ